MITETKMIPEDKNIDYFRFGGYNIFRLDRGTEDRGGGVVILVDINLNSESIPANLYQNNTESIACMVKFGNKTLVLGCLYRPPNSPHEYNVGINRVISSLSNITADQYLICGDFNYPRIDWTNHLVNRIENSIEQFFYDECQNAFLWQHVKEITRQRGTNEPSVLDLVFSKNELEIEEIKYDPPIGRSDHAVLKFKFALEGEIAISNEEFIKKKYFQADYIIMKRVFELINWESDMSETELQAKWDYFVHIYNQTVDRLVPVGHSQGKFSPKCKWMTRYALISIERKVKAWKQHQRRKSSRSWDFYCNARNHSVEAVRNAKWNFEKSLADEVKNGNVSAFYAYARSRTTIKETVARVTQPDGSLTVTKKNTADTINATFQSVFVREGNEPVPAFESRYDGPLLEDVTFSPDTIKDILEHLKESSAPGPDGIHPKVLSECAQYLSLPLYLIFKHSLEVGELPCEWKTANVSPIFKKGKKSDPLNYRPISLTSVPCKVMEKVIRDEIMEHLEQNNLLSKHQHGFRSNRSCLTQLLEYFSEIHKSLDDSDPIDAIYLDCKKAFDTVPHKRLIAKLRAYGISGKILKWIESFLKNRTQKVVISGVHSDSLPIWSGVPQGSVLGPLLFLIYINDLLDGISSGGKLFADDAKIFKRIKSLQDRLILQQDLIKLQEWSSKWLMEFNEKKCKVMHIGVNPKYNYYLNNTLLEETTEEKDLGVYVTPDWKPATQVAKAAAKANSALGRIKHTFTYMNKKMFLGLYPSLVRSHMEYAVQAWSPHYQKDIDILEKVQQRATRIVPEFSDMDYDARLLALGLTSLKERRLRGDLIEVFKIMHGYENLRRKDFFTLASETNNYGLRGHKFKIWKPDTKTMSRKWFFDIRPIEAWNRLPEEVVCSKSVNEFKNKLDAHFKRGGTLLRAP